MNDFEKSQLSDLEITLRNKMKPSGDDPYDDRREFINTWQMMLDLTRILRSTLDEIDHLHRVNKENQS